MKNKKDEIISDAIDSNRRDLLIKGAYAAPAILTLSAAPSFAAAGSKQNKPKRSKKSKNKKVGKKKSGKKKKAARKKSSKKKAAKNMAGKLPL